MYSNKTLISITDIVAVSVGMLLGVPFLMILMSPFIGFF